MSQGEHRPTMKVAIVGQRGNERAVDLVGDLVASLREYGVTPLVDELTAEELAADVQPINVERVGTADLVVSVGGDGTFLFAARGADSTPIMGVNLGEVGFLNAIPPERAVEAVRAEVDRIRESGSAQTRELLRLVATGPDWTLPPSLNEVVVQGPRRGHGHGVDVEVLVDGSLYTAGHADGVLIATPTGSTAYNLSEGGPLVHPGCNGIVVTVMCGTEGMPPLVVGDDRTVTVRVTGAPQAVSVSDGRVQEAFNPPGSVHVERAADPVAVAGPPLDFFSGLEKLD